MRILAACLMLMATFSWATAADPHLVEVADGVYVFAGAPGDMSPGNLGRIGNSGFIVGPRSVTVIDTGVSHAHGMALVAAIRRVTDKPLGPVVLTHAVQEFLYGTTAFVEAGGEPLCHRRTAELMRSRCEHCLDNLRLLLGSAAMEGTRLLVPAEVIEGDATLSASGRTIDLIHPGWASTPGDLLVLDRQTGVLFAGGVVLNNRVPELRDGQLEQWIKAIDTLRELPVRVIVPGHGPPMAANGGAATRSYLQALDHRVRLLYEGGASLMETVDSAALPEFSAWDGYEALHRKNAQLRYLQLELEDLDRR